MFSQLSPQEKLEWLLKHEGKLQVMNKTILDLVVTYKKSQDQGSKSNRVFQKLVIAMGQVNNLCDTVVDQHTSNIVSMKQDDDEEKLKLNMGLSSVENQVASRAVSHQYFENLKAMQAMPAQVEDAETAKELEAVVKRCIPKGLQKKGLKQLLSGKPQGSKRSQVPAQEDSTAPAIFVSDSQPVEPHRKLNWPPKLSPRIPGSISRQ